MPSLLRYYRIFFSFIVRIFELAGENRINHANAFCVLEFFEICYFYVASPPLLRVMSIEHYAFNSSLASYLMVFVTLTVLNGIALSRKSLMPIQADIEKWSPTRIKIGFLIASMFLILSAASMVILVVALQLRSIGSAGINVGH